MNLILNESKRDNMLQPFVNVLASKGIETNVGQLKTVLLKKLTREAGMHNLSLGSNYYLAGAARYYFNGDLTVDGKVGILNGDEDAFNEEVCKRLDALILILRNSIIDSIGETFEQPEDFGTLKIEALLKKYNAKINKELGIVSNKKNEKVEVDNLNRDPNVGKNYFFDIIYNFNMATKYERPTASRSWCVTYNVGNYNYYTRNTRPQSHLIVFGVYGYESIPKCKEVNMWKKGPSGRPKPQDTYGNSLIAFFQSNDSYLPANLNGYPLITSRWNHWTNDDVSVEADRAYSFEEFKEITGVSDEDLMRIYEIWSKDKSKYAEKKEKTGRFSPEESKKRLNDLRALKYAQIRIKSGETLEHVLPGIEKTIQLEKSLIVYSLRNMLFLADKGNIVFESIRYLPNAVNSLEKIASSLFSYREEKSGKPFIANSVIIHDNEGNKGVIYNFRQHKILSVEGLNYFSGIGTANPYFDKGEAPRAIYCAQTGKRCIIVDSYTGMPVKLPNGRYVFEYAIFKGLCSWAPTRKSNYMTNNSLVFIMVDSASIEGYFYRPSTGTFSTFNKNNVLGLDEISAMYINYEHDGFSMTICGKVNDEWGGIKEERYIPIDNEGNQIDCLPNGELYTKYPISGIWGKYISFSLDSKALRKLHVPRVDRRPCVLYDSEKKEYVKDTRGNVLHYSMFYKSFYPKRNLFLANGSNIGVDVIDVDTGEVFSPVLLYGISYTFKNLGNEEYFKLGVYSFFHAESDIKHLKDNGFLIDSDDGIVCRYEDVLHGRPTKVDTNNPVIRINKEQLSEIIYKLCLKMLK